ncbi:MAG: hypothetical protein VYC34_06635, partial [Planctomycetota bacterium]|nr:hypothetical protein [Planctomycetota bacterium]
MLAASGILLLIALGVGVVATVQFARDGYGAATQPIAQFPANQSTTVDLTDPEPVVLLTILVDDI